MRKYLLTITCCLAAVLNLPAATWSNGESSPNQIAVKGGEGDTGTYAIGRPPVSDLKWNGANGVSFNVNSKGELFVQKSAGGKCEFYLLFEFSKPVKKFRFITPECQGLDLAGGDMAFEYAANADKRFIEIGRLSAKTPGYKVGGSLPPVTGKWIEFPEGKELRKLTLHMVFFGYSSCMMFGGGDKNGAVIEYEVGGNPPSARLMPDASRIANTYFIDQPPRMIVHAKNVKAVTVFDLGRNTAAGECTLSKLGGDTVADLPALSPGTYELRVDCGKGAEADLSKRIALLRPPRVLTWDQTRKSPFGIVGIGGDGRFRESADLNGPLLGRMMGVHQLRGGLWSWVGVNEHERGKYDWGNYQDRVAVQMENGMVMRSCVSWTPAWAVDKSKVKSGDWSGHYPPKKEFLTDYAEFCRRSAEKNPCEQEYEIWNEPNNEPYGSFKGTFAEFVELCKTATEAIHSVRPDAKMILGTTGDADVGYVARLLKAGLSKHFSIVDIHPYRHTDRGPEDGLLGDIYRLKKAIQKYGNNQAIIFSEVGWPTHRKVVPSYMPVTEAVQAWYNSRTLILSLAAGVKRVHFHMLTDWGPNLDEPEHNFGFVKVNGDPKLTVSSVSITARHLERAQFLGVENTPEATFAWHWKTPWVNDATLVTVWADLPTANKSMSWLTIPGKLVDAEDLWGGFPGTGRLKVEKNCVKVLPGGDPIFLYIRNADNHGLKPLPPDLTPFLIKRAKAPVIAASEKIDYDHLANPMLPVTQSKAMGFAGIGDNNPGNITSDRAEKESSFSAYHSPEGLVLAVNVRSGKPMSNNHSGWWIWAGDCVRLYVGKDREASFMTPDTYQICLAPVTKDNGPGQAVLISYDAAGGFDAGALIPGSRIEAANTSEGWTMMALLPWSFFRGEPKKGDVWRFDLTAPGVAWNSPADDKWTNPMHWGELEFD